MNLDQELQAFVNQTVGPFIGWDAVEAGVIRHWCDALDDQNPNYHDRVAAQANGYRDITAPPTMLQAWGMRGYRNQFPEGSDTRNPFEVLGFLEQHGYISTVAVNCEQEYETPLCIGDRVHFTSHIESISEQKTTALGTGYFVTEVSEYKNQRDELVGRMTFRVLKYKAHAAQQTNDDTLDTNKPKPIKRMRPVRNYDTAFFWEGVDQGELRIQKCSDCHTLRHPPSPACPECQSLQWNHITSSGRGTIYSFVVNHYPEIPPFDYPNVVVLVELEEGTRLVSNLVGVKPHSVEIGTEVAVQFAEVEPGFTLHYFTPQIAQQ